MDAVRLLLLDGSDAERPSSNSRWVAYKRRSSTAFSFRKMESFRKGNLRTDEALGAGAFNAAISQATDSTPLYGREVWPAYPERFGSAVGDIVSQNFFGDFFLATAFQ